MTRTPNRAITVIAAIWIAAGLIVAKPAAPGTTVYKCVKDGHTTLTDKPCPADKTDPNSYTAQLSTTVVPSSKDPSPVGKWSGQLQFQETSNGQTVQAAHSVAVLLAEFTLDGKVMGSSSENGCRILGVWSQGITPTLIWIDVTIHNCDYADLDRRYHGSFIVARPDSSGEVSVQSIGAPFSKDMAKYFDIKGTLRR
jgi:hypothetical protein